MAKKVKKQPAMTAKMAAQSTSLQQVLQTYIANLGAAHQGAVVHSNMFQALTISKKKYDPLQYQLEMNESLTHTIQNASGQSTADIYQFFYEVIKKHAIIMKARNDQAKKIPTKVKFLSNYRTYGYYPGTKVHFVACTNVREGCIYGHDPKDTTFAQVNSHDHYNMKVSVPQKTIILNHDKLKDIIVEGILIEGGGEPPISNPTDTKYRNRFKLEDLDAKTETKEYGNKKGNNNGK
jgi:hypothetical protein